MDKLKISYRIARESLVVELAGELGMTSTGGFDETLSTALEGSGITRVVLDCSRLEFVDSSGLGVMVTLLRRLRESGGGVDLTGVRAGLLELLYITKLEKHFVMYKSVDDALAQVTATAPGPDSGPIKPELRHEPEHAASSAQDRHLKAGPGGPTGLPPYEGLANYPTWYVTQWFLNREELHQRATEVITQSAEDKEAARALHRLLLTRCDGALKASTLVSGLFGFTLGQVSWPDVIDEIRKKPAKSYNKG